MQKCLKKHILDGLFLHNEVVRIWGLTYYIELPAKTRSPAIFDF